MFEWLLLQDIYGFESFPTTSKVLDILKKIEDGELNQHEGSYLVGKYLKEMYIDSALKTKEKLEAKERNKKTPKKPFANVEKKISYKDYKILNKLT